MSSAFFGTGGRQARVGRKPRGASAIRGLEQHMATLTTMIPTYNDELEKLRKRVSRIERRLELTD